jgi:hypothetical protein
MRPGRIFALGDGREDVKVMEGHGGREPETRASHWVMRLRRGDETTRSREGGMMAGQLASKMSKGNIADLSSSSTTRFAYTAFTHALLNYFFPPTAPKRSSRPTRRTLSDRESSRSRPGSTPSRREPKRSLLPMTRTGST